MAHQSDGPALTLGHLGMDTEQCALVVISESWRSVFLPIIAYKHRERRRIQIEQTQRAPEGGQCETADKR